MNRLLKNIKILWRQDKALFFIVFYTSICAGAPVDYASFVPAWKYISIFGLWYAILKFPYKPCTISQLGKFDRNMILILIFLALISIFSVPFRDDSLIYNSSSIYGNKYISWLANPLSIVLFYPLLFLSAQSNEKYLKKIFFALFIAIVVSIIFSFLSPYYENHIFFFLPLLYPLYKYHKILFKIALIIFVLKATAILGLARVQTFYFAFVIVAYLCCIKFKLYRLVKVIAIIALLSPIYFIIDACFYNESVFSMLDNLSDDKLLNQDTRTFLYQELFLDLTRNNDLIFGKGCHSFYFSDFFDNKDGMYGYRNSIEVPVLNWLLKVGLLYCIIYLTLLIRAVYFSIWHSRSWFMKICGVLLSGYFFLQFISDMIGSNLFQIMIWTITGMTLSSYWRNLTDREIYDKILPKRNVGKNGKNQQ